MTTEPPKVRQESTFSQKYRVCIAMTTRCLKLIENLNDAIEDENDRLVLYMTDPGTLPKYLCVEKNSTYTQYGRVLGIAWNDLVADLKLDDQTCARRLEMVERAGKFYYQNREQFKELSPDKIVESLTDIDWEGLILQGITRSLMEDPNTHQFRFDPDLAVTIRRLAFTILHECQCQLPGLFKTIISKYRGVYREKIIGKTYQEALSIIHSDYRMLKSFFINLAEDRGYLLGGEVMESAAAKLAGLYSFSIEGELDKLIPSELGSLKDFFVKIISHYYSNLHPIVWAQIFRGMTSNLFIELPHTREQLFSFASNQLLLNSGPFILKILQLIRPVLSPELAKKYGLSGLTYPLMSDKQVDSILRRFVIDWNKYVIIGSFSASVGHVVLVHHIATPDKPFIIKMPKPLSIAQSCWEWNTMKDLFPPGCEREFVLDMLRSNGREFNVRNEIANIQRGKKIYTMSYSKAFKKPIQATLTTVDTIPGIVRDTWCAMTMTLAPGIPLSKLVESDLLTQDTVYRAKLHRCCDLLVYRFFGGILQDKFYHGDLHAGNIFFSFEKDQMTLIDFGAMGEIDVLEDVPDMNALLEIIVMSSFNNYPQILDKLTQLLNRKCSQPNCNGESCSRGVIDTSSEGYKSLREELQQDRILCYQYLKVDKLNTDAYTDHIMSDERISRENLDQLKRKEKRASVPDHDGIYHYLNISVPSRETVVENSDVIPDGTTLRESGSVSFNRALEKIIKYYAVSGVNIAVKLNEFYEFQKAYALLLGVMAKVGYNGYRTSFFLKKCFKDPRNLKLILRATRLAHVLTLYKQEKKVYKDFVAEMVAAGVKQY